MAGPTDERVDLIIPHGLPDPPGAGPHETKVEARGRLLKHEGRIRRGELVPCYVVRIEAVRIEMHALAAPGSARVPSGRPRGRPRSRLPLERLRRHLDQFALGNFSLRQHAARLGVARSTLVAGLRALGLK